MSEPLASSQGPSELLNIQESTKYKGLKYQPGIHLREGQTSQQANTCITQTHARRYGVQVYACMGTEAQAPGLTLGPQAVTTGRVS